MASPVRKQDDELARAPPPALRRDHRDVEAVARDRKKQQRPVLAQPGAQGLEGSMEFDDDGLGQVMSMG